MSYRALVSNVLRVCVLYIIRRCYLPLLSMRAYLPLLMLLLTLYNTFNERTVTLREKQKLKPRRYV
jgi:hypothetical protein